MRAFITGGAGFIGRHLTRRLLDDGHEVSIVDSGFTGRLDDVDPRAHLHRHDIAELSDVDWGGLLAGHEVVFHLAARKYNTPGVTADQIVDTNVRATWALAHAAADAGVRRVVFTSSLYAYGSLGPDAMRETDVPAPRTLYGASKVMGEHILRTVAVSTSLEWAVARLFFIYGPGQYADGGYKSVIVTNFERLRQQLPPTITGDGLQALDYVYVEDAVEALWRLSAEPASGSVVNVASGRARTIQELTAAMQRVAGSDVEPASLPPDWTAGTVRCGDPEAAHRLLGWTAGTTLEEGLDRTWNDLRA